MNNSISVWEGKIYLYIFNRDLTKLQSLDFTAKGDILFIEAMHPLLCSLDTQDRLLYRGQLLDHLRLYLSKQKKGTQQLGKKRKLNDK